MSPGVHITWRATSVPQWRSSLPSLLRSVSTPAASAQSVFTNLPFTSIQGLSPHTYIALNDAFQYKHMTRVQAAAIPEALKGKDLFVRAQTGTGKTIAFLVPMLERLNKYGRSFDRAKREKKTQLAMLDKLNSRVKRLRASDAVSGPVPSPKVLVNSEYIHTMDIPHLLAPPTPIGLILVPTRELGQQISVEARKLCEFSVDTEVAIFVGGMPIEGDRRKIDYMVNRNAEMKSSLFLIFFE